MLQIIAKLMGRTKPGTDLPNRFGANVFAVCRRKTIRTYFPAPPIRKPLRHLRLPSARELVRGDDEKCPALIETSCAPQRDDAAAQQDQHGHSYGRGPSPTYLHIRDPREDSKCREYRDDRSNQHPIQ